MDKVSNETRLVATTPQEIREACQKQHAEIGAVLTPEYCVVCRGCPIATIVIMLAGGPPPGQGWRPLEERMTGG